MTSVLSIAGRSWAFVRSQPVMMDIALWLIAVPYAVADILTMIMGQAGWHTILLTPPPPGRINAAPLILAINIAAALFHVWGEASALTAAKRLISRNAGRARTSFSATARQARGLIIPLLITEILWSCNMLLWSLLFIIPGIIVATLTFFCPVTTVAEGKRYRDALRASAAVVKKHLAATFMSILGILALAFGPAIALNIALIELTADTPWWTGLLAGIFSNLVWGFSVVLFETMCTIAYADLKKKA